ncbi:RSP_2648 family PIN domain-containing protein [Cochlodiniinecator piscidefendens]|uniref:RSP_2648 family PIN domain-containing protein n=1 Tax=Cochlodiniinecator piscidefendens TaxID=2715756 RepID=UPI00140ADC8C|nr:PIN domain-containing protein [Cochlodiniinecator piscidefendens]
MRALLDACVIYPTVMREVLLGAAKAGLYRPLWSDRILEEWARATRRLGPEAEAIARGDIAIMRGQWPAANVNPKAGDLARLWLPDENDIHVLAAAIAGSADTIVTMNAKDFPRQILQDEGVRRIDPDGFLYDLWLDHSEVMEDVAHAVHAEAERLSGQELDIRKLFKKAKLHRFSKAISVT